MNDGEGKILVWKLPLSGILAINIISCLLLPSMILNTRQKMERGKIQGTMETM